ncbi:hypothetical protein [Streptomyces sp. NPDC006510]
MASPRLDPSSVQTSIRSFGSPLCPGGGLRPLRDPATVVLDDKDGAD